MATDVQDLDNKDGKGGRLKAILSRIKQNKTLIWKLVGLVSAFFCILMASFIYAFDAYANALKSTFELSQVQVETISSLSLLGNSIALPAGFMQEKLGHRWTLGFALLVSFPILMLFWAAQYQVQFYGQHIWIIYIYFFVLGFGAICAVIAVYPVIVLNFPASQRGCITSILGTPTTAGSAVFAAIYGGAFLQGESGVFDFFLFTALAFALTFSLGIVLVRSMREEVKPLSERSALLMADMLKADLGDGKTHDNDTNDKADGKADEKDDDKDVEKDKTGWILLREPEFYTIMGSYAMSVSVQYAFFNNIPTVLKSLQAPGYNTFFTVLAPLVSGVGRLALGVCSDVTLSKRNVPRVAYQLVCNSLQALFLFVCVFFLEHMPLFLVTTLVVSLGSGVMTSQSSSRIADAFGTKHFSRNFSISFLGFGIVTVVLQVAFGALYDAYAVSTPTEEVCHGRRCFVWSFVIFFALSVFAALLDAYSVYSHYRHMNAPSRPADS